MILTIKIIFLPQIGMARKEVHPDYHEVEIETFEKDGTKRVFKSMSTIKGDKVIAEVNIYKHPAWKEDTKVDTEGSINKTLQKFNSKFSRFKKA